MGRGVKLSGIGLAMMKDPRVQAEDRLTLVLHSATADTANE